jgi:hypothetical protein
MMDRLNQQKALLLKFRVVFHSKQQKNFKVALSRPDI